MPGRHTLTTVNKDRSCPSPVAVCPSGVYRLVVQGVILEIRGALVYESNARNGPEVCGGAARGGESAQEIRTAPATVR